MNLCCSNQVPQMNSQWCLHIDNMRLYLWGVYGIMRNVPTECILHTLCLCLQVLGHGAILGFPVGFTASSLCEIRQQVPVVNEMIQPLCCLEFWSKVLALSVEKPKTSFPTGHAYCVFCMNV